jgi:hypothetical protein
VAFNLGDALLQRAGEISGDVPEELLVDALFFGSLELDNLVQSGFGCNGAGCSYAFDDLRIYGTDATAGLVSVSTTAAEVDGAGVCWIPVDTPEGMPWLDMQTVSARTGTGPALPRRAFKFDPIGGRLGVDLMALEAGDEPRSKLKLAGLRLRDSEEDGQTVEVAIKPRTEEEDLLLAPVDLLGQKPVVRETFGGPFAQDMAEWIRAWSPDDGGVLRLVCRKVAHRMLTGRLVAERDLAQYPVYSFRYRADPGVRCDLLVRAGEAEAWLSFLNRGQALAGRPGRLAGADDGRWHWVAAPVGPAWCRTAKNAAGTVLESLQFVDRGYCAQADGLTMLLDDLTAYPLLEPDADGAVRVRFARRDPGRLDEIRYVVTDPGEAGPDLAGRERPDGVASLQTDRRFVEERIALPRAGVRVLRWAARADSFWQEGPPCLLAVDQVPPEISALHPRPRVSSTDSHGAAARTEELVEGCLAVLRRGGGDVVDEAFGRLHAHLEAMPPGDREAAAEPLRRLHHERGKEIGEAVRRQVAESLLIPLQHWFGRDAAAFEMWLGRNARETRERLKRTVARALDSDDEAARAFAAEYLAAVGLATGGWRAGERTKGLLLLARADRSAADASGSGLEGTLSEGVSFAEGGVFGSAFRFAGSGGEEANAVSFGDLDALDSAGAFSVALWFRRDRDRAGNSNHGTSNILVSQGSDEGNDNLEIGTDGSHVELYLDTVGGDKPRVYDAGIRDGVWYHLALTYDATRPYGTALYLDGREVHRWTAWDGPLDGSGQSPFTLGNTYHEEAPFEGLIDEVAVFTRALRPDEIAEYCERSGLTARSSGERITCRLDDEGLGIRPGSISVRINGSGPPEAANPIRYHPLDGHLVVRTADWPRRTAGAFAEDGERIEVQVEARDLAGSRVERTWSWTMDYGRDRTAPPLPRLVWQPVEGRLLQPADLTDAKSILSWDEEETQVRVREGGPLEGKVLEVRGGRKSVGAVTLNTSPIDLRQGLIIGGWVRRHPRFRANFRFFVGGQVYGLRFLDRHHRGVVPAGRIPLEKPDDGWQFFFVDAAELIRAELPKGTTRIVRRIELGHPGRRRNRPHIWLRLAHLFVCSEEDLRNGIAVDWSAVHDPTGVEYALLRDANAATVPDSGYREECHAVVESVAPGDYLHLGVRDGAGNVRATHLRILGEDEAE